MCIFVHAVVALVFLKNVAELVHVQLVEGVELLGCWLFVPLHPNGSSNCKEVTRCRTAELVNFMICNMFDVCLTHGNEPQGQMPSCCGQLHIVQLAELYQTNLSRSLEFVDMSFLPK